ncbi:MAG: formyltransferase [Gammaproteobacteria bacterium]|nr:formyltransferase [Gammaproteobacteria bacterium]MBU1730711.1 formyltransferase [Gammaproteobacteria bacterium]MBU1893215.1 formyltransferase [Gammaproteobacteria bacterium]
MTQAVVFAYHNVGVRCLSVLLAHGIKVPLVVTHTDNPSETIWFDSVAELARLHDIPVITPDDPNAPEVIERIRSLQPDFLFSFYFRNMLKKEILDIPKLGAYNMHGSLLPQYRGRVPVNWAIIRGEKETGSTLHVMNEKPDNGAIVDQQAVPILPDDTALEVFHKVTCAAEITLNRCLPGLIDGNACLKQQDLSQGGYFGGRKPEDGKIPWLDSAQNIHNLVRAVAPPYPGAYTKLAGKQMRLLRTLMAPAQASRSEIPSFCCKNGRCHADCGDGGVLRVLSFELDGQHLTPEQFTARFGEAPLPFEDY